MSSKASTVDIRTIFTVMLTAMFAGCGGGSTGNSALIGSGSSAENSRGSPSLPSTISPATEMPEDIITANGTAKLVLREDFQANSPSSPNILSLQGAIPWRQYVGRMGAKAILRLRKDGGSLWGQNDCTSSSTTRTACIAPCHINSLKTCGSRLRLSGRVAKT